MDTITNVHRFDIRRFRSLVFIPRSVQNFQYLHARIFNILHSCAPRHKKIWITQYACFVIAYICIYTYIAAFDDFFRNAYSDNPFDVCPVSAFLYSREVWRSLHQFDSESDFPFFGRINEETSFKIIVSVDFRRGDAKISDKLSGNHSLLLDLC